MASSVEIYEALKPTVGEEAAKMVAEAFPMTDQVATKADVAALRSDLGSMETRMFRWMLGFFATLWVSNAGMIVTLLLKG